MECTKCGAYIKGSDNFCSYCGNKIEKTIPLMIPHDKRNYEPLENICQGIIDEIKEGTWNSDNDDEHYIYETAMITFFGKDVFDWINKNTD